MRSTNTGRMKYERKCKAAMRAINNAGERRRRALLAERRVEVRADAGISDHDFADVPLPVLPEVSALEKHVHEHALCKDDVDWLVPLNGQRGVLAEQKAICLTCPVMLECRQVCDEIELGPGVKFGTAIEYMAGVWGAEGPSDRARRRRREMGMKPREGRGSGPRRVAA